MEFNTRIKKVRYKNMSDLDEQELIATRKLNGADREIKLGE